ncbi:hypothetical protein, partial [Bifidobacterium panos]
MSNEAFIHTIRDVSALRPLVGVDVGGTKTRIDIVRDGLADSWTTPSDTWRTNSDSVIENDMLRLGKIIVSRLEQAERLEPVSYPPLRAHET